MSRIIIETDDDGQIPEWATELESRLDARLDIIKYRLGEVMALTDELAQAVQDLTASEGSVLAELDKLVQLAQERGSVSDADIQAAVNSIKDKVQAVNDRIQQIDAGQGPAPEPTPEPAPEQV